MGGEVMEIKYIKEIIEYLLYNHFNLVKCNFEHQYIMKYDDFINQIVFELYYDSYINKCKTINISTYVKEEIIGDKNLKTSDCTSLPEYKTATRYYKKYRQHNDNNVRKIYELFHKGTINEDKNKNIQYKYLEEIEEKLKGHKIFEYQKFQLTALQKYELFNIIQKGIISSSKKINDSDLIDMLQDYEKIYEEIDKSFNSYFEKCVQYYQLELMCRIELKYMISKTLKNSKRKLKQKKQDIEYFSSLVSVSYGNYQTYQNKFIISYKDFLELYTDKDIDKFYKIPEIIFNLSCMRYYIKNMISNLSLDYDYSKEEEFFKDFLGKGQHIQSKDWQSIKLKDFRDLFLV